MGLKLRPANPVICGSEEVYACRATVLLLQYLSGEANVDAWI